MTKQKDNNTIRFLFAASRGDTSTISLMCDQGFDPNIADYDQRTALMVAAMKGNTETVEKIIDYQANPNLVDIHGTSALYEATRNGHEATMDVLLKNGATLCMDEAQAAGKLCETIFKDDLISLRRLLKANIQVDARDYDKRTCAHIAATEGNLVAMKLMVEYGADLTLADRWGNTVFDEATRVNENHLLKYLEELKGEETKKE
jgi:ankyrin repeat protein